MAEPPEVVVEVVGWDGIDPLTELPLFHSTAEDSIGGSLYVSGEPAIFCWMVGGPSWGFTGVMMKHQLKSPRCWQSSGASWSDITEKTGKRWSCPSPARCYCSNCGQFSPGGSASWWRRGRSLLRQWIVGHNLSSGRGLGPWRKPGLPVPGLSNFCRRGYPPPSV